MNLQDRIIYLNRPAWIVTKRQPNFLTGETCRHYGLARKPNSVKVDYRDVPEHLITRASVAVSCGGSVQVLEF